jgi:uncharacterized protein
MVLEGVVTNVAAFGAFVDVGVHQDGLVHVSAMAKTFVTDPRDVVKPGDIVRVKVLDVDIPRKRIALTLRLDDAAGGAASAHRPGTAGQGAGGGAPARGRQRGTAAPRDTPPRPRRAAAGAPTGALADALRRAGLVDEFGNSIPGSTGKRL